VKIMFYKETNFKKTSVGRIPEDWEVVRLGDDEIAEIRRNKIVGNIVEIAFIPMELIPDQEIFAKYEIRDLKDVSSSTYCEAGDLLLAKITPSFENGKQGIVPKDIPNGFALATTEVYPIVCKDIDRLFLFYLLKFPKFRKVLEFSMRGTTGRQRVPKEAVEKLKIPLPTSQEQQKIAEVLLTVDEAIRKTDEVIAKTERLKKGLMQELLTRGIGHKEFKDTEIGRIPKEWKVVKLSDKAEVVSGFGFPLDYQGKRSGKYPFIKVNDLNLTQKYAITADNFIDDEDLKALKAEVFPPNTIIFPKIGMAIYLNKFRILKTWGTFDNNIAGVIPKEINPEFLFYYFLGKTDLKQLSGRTTAPSIRKTTLESILIPYPSLPEQQKIAEILSTVDKKLELERNEKTRLERIKQGLMDLLLTGKIRVKVN